ncbi:hypothetical protein CY34DRAFT_17223 [Suillus luteus UH-Slu-Lm8-n1]|uniref:Uncharacterized protein n=1 Tax=Suillus luteus UH-Slu-Lm8-n1 TaxID=930992 RepID=A0A0D0AAJ9_9AGAM|nr:hypothetical protein CY34DRAFT_17223 [Suillus luteus UH-Slu-Lm8-n1]
MVSNNEIGDVNTQEQILGLLSQKKDAPSSQHSELPANVHIIIISHPLQDICDTLDASHVHRISMDNILHVLAGLRNFFNDANFKTLAEKSDGLFKWARLACEHFKSTDRLGEGPMTLFNAVVAGTSEKGMRLLDIMYARILGDIMLEDNRRESIPLFCSVMGQILASSSDAEGVIKSLGSLVTAITDPQGPICPLHASFNDFLTDKSRSQDFFVGTSSVQSDLAFATLRVMDSECGLRFNICSLENSRLPNSSVLTWKRQ